MPKERKIFTHPFKEEIRAMLLENKFTMEQIVEEIKKLVDDRYKLDPPEDRKRLYLAIATLHEIRKTINKEEIKLKRDAILDSTEDGKRLNDLLGEDENKDRKNKLVKIATTPSEQAKLLAIESLNAQMIDARATFVLINTQCLQQIEKLSDKKHLSASDHRSLNNYLTQLRELVVTWGKAIGALDGEGVLTAVQAKAVETITGRVAESVRGILEDMDPMLVPKFFAIWRDKFVKDKAVRGEFDLEQPNPEAVEKELLGVTAATVFKQRAG